MVDKAIVLLASSLVLLCLVTVVQGGWFSCSSDQNYVNFDKLEKWIATNNYDRDLASFKANLDHLTDLKVRHAADILVGIVEAAECDEETMDNFREMAEAGVVLKGKPRVEKLMWAALERLNGLCGEYIDDKLLYLYETGLLSPPFDKFLEVVVMKPLGWKLPLFSDQGPERRPTEEFSWYIGSANGHSWDPRPDEWASYLRTLAQDDKRALVNSYEMVPNSKGNQFKTLKSYGAFKYAIRKYLASNCQMVTSALGDIIEALFGLLELRCSTNKSCYQQFILSRGNNTTVSTLLFAYKICRPFPRREFYYNSDMFDKYSEQESFMQWGRRGN